MLKGGIAVICRLDDPGRAAPLFDGWEETLIWSCLDGSMGELYGDDALRPQSAAALLGDFAFFAGKPCRELIARMERPFLILTPQNEDWSREMEAVYGPKVRRTERYAFDKNPDAFSIPDLERAASSLPAGYALVPIDENYFHWCAGQDWSRDFVSNFSDYADYARRGLGVLALRDGVPAAGASSYSVYSGGIEIEIDTRREYRRQGLARACGSKLILACLERGLYPSWDAQNLISVALAKQLGYRFRGAYPVYELTIDI